MIDGFFIPVAGLYFVISAVLFLFGVNYIYLSIRTWRIGKTGPEPPTWRGPWPRVTVQLPIYNELYVVERLIQAVTQLDYPSDRLQIQVLDDSTDETVSIAQRAVAQAKATGVDIVHLHRTDRQGYKAGALQDALATASGTFIAILDADFLPPPDFLKRALPYVQEPKVAFVQTRWGHLNRDYSWLTFLQSLAIDAHFMVEQFARSRTGYWFNFNGTGGVWRRAAIEEAGGWTADTLTEDLDLSYRAYLCGWEGRYAREIVVPGELPVDFRGFRRQQHRWARGSLECARKLIAKVWRAPTPWSVKYQATLHLFGYSVHFLLFLMTLLYPIVVQFTSQHPEFSNLYGFGYLFGLTSLAPTIFFIIGQHQQGHAWWHRIPKILSVSVMGSGMMLNTVRAFGQIYSRRTQAFERTAKFGIEDQKQDWMKQRYQLRFDPIVAFEIALGLFSLFTTWTAWKLGSWGIGFFALMFGTGLLLVGSTTIIQTVGVYRKRKARQRRTASEQAQWILKS